MMRNAIAVLLALVVATSAMGELSHREQKDRIARLSEKYRQFLIDVEPIMVPSEKEAFLRLETDPQRDAFVDDFWRRRDAAVGTTNFTARDQYYDRLDFVKTTFEQVSSDRGRIYLVQGPPLAMIDVKCPAYFQPLQIWTYGYIDKLGHDVILLFYQPRGHREFRLWEPTPFANDAAMNELRASPENIESGSAMNSGNIMLDCDNGELVMKALTLMKLNSEHLHVVYEPPAVNGEDMTRVLRSVVLADPKAPKLAADIQVAYPGAEGNKTDAQLTVLVPRAQLKTTQAGTASVYTLEVVGEVLRDGAMWEKYRYRFDYPGDVKDEKLPVVIDRMLRPADYKSRIKVSDPTTGAETILETDLHVPEVQAKPTEEGKTLTAIQEQLQSTRASLRIVPLADGVTSGVQTIQTMVSGGGIAGVEFWLDGKKVATRRSPPYSLDLDFGTMPRARRIRAVAIDSHGEPITGDEIAVNTGTDPFRVRIASPRIAPKLSGPTRVAVDVKIPDGKQLASLDLYWNEQRVATMYDPPFVQTVNIPSTEGVGYLRAVAKLKDSDADPAEDVVMINTPDFMETVDVHLVELPTTVLRDGRPVDGLTEKAFKVFDDGQPVKLAKFEQVRNLPLSIGMAVDTSGSMEPRMQAARDAGAEFFKRVLKKGDKAFLVAFDAQPHIVLKWSDNISDIYSGLAKLRSEESTALYDAVVYSLYNFLGVKGQKALILLTDGKDTASKFTFEQSLEYAQRAAVPIYTIGIGIHSTDMEVKAKLGRLASETGGAAYYIEDIAQLAAIYASIENELRSQYVLGFYPASDVKPGGKWHEVTVQTAEGKAKTIRGYYP